MVLCLCKSVDRHCFNVKILKKKEETIKSSSFKVKCPIQCKINNENSCAKMKNVV